MKKDKMSNCITPNLSYQKGKMSNGITRNLSYQKGITPIISVVLLLMITIAIIGFAFLFFQSSFTGVTEGVGEEITHQTSQFGKNFKIESAVGSQIYIRNLGTATVVQTEMSVFLNGEPVSFTMTDVLKNRPGTINLVDVILVENDDIKITFGLMEHEYTVTAEKKCSVVSECSEKICSVAECTEGYCVWYSMTNQEDTEGSLKCDSDGNGCIASDCWCNENGECAEQPPFDPGPGGDDLVLLTSGETRSDLNTYAALVDGLYTAGSDTITVDDATGFEVDDEIMIIQMRGDGVSAMPGIYEFKKISSIDVNTIILNGLLLNRYTISGSSYIGQIVKVAHFASVELYDGTSITTQPWDGSKGGILVFRASTGVNLFTGSKIDVTGTGYLGGIAQNTQEHYGLKGESETGTNTIEGMNPNTNIGGGGGDFQPKPWNDWGYYSCGGAGGGYGTFGINGEAKIGKCNGGIGGNALPDLVTLLDDKIFFGGGGGSGGVADSPYAHVAPSGAGGTGGGIILIFSNEITVAGEIIVNGAAGESIGDNGGAAAAGGGGAGGSILLKANTVDIGTNIVKSLGGAGGLDDRWSGYGSDGGAGGKGRIEIHYVDSITGTTDPGATVVDLTP